MNKIKLTAIICALLSVLMITGSLPVSISAKETGELADTKEIYVYEDHFESDHTYPDNYDETWVVSRPGAESITLYFSYATYTEKNFDFIYIYAGEDLYGVYSGDELESEVITVYDDEVSVRLVSDYSGAEYGFEVYNIEVNYPSTDFETDPTESYVPDFNTDGLPPKASGYNRYYFYMPESWYNEYATCAGIYWWDGTDACFVWPGYVANETNTPGVYYYDVCSDVTTIIWNNAIDGGTDYEEPIYTAAYSTVNIGIEYYDKDDSVYYPDGLDSFDDMIYVLDISKTEVNDYSGKSTYRGEWFYYYGNGEYGLTPQKGNAYYNERAYYETPTPIFTITTDPVETTFTEYTEATYPDTTTGINETTVAVVIQPDEYVATNACHSPHDYPDNYDKTWIIGREGAIGIEITFSEDTYVEEGYDWIHIYSGDEYVSGYTGSSLAGKTFYFNSDEVKIRLITDSGNSYYGFYICDIVANYQTDTVMPTEDISIDYFVPPVLVISDTPDVDISSVDGLIIGYMGDNDGNDSINIKDATNIQKYIAKLTAFSARQSALSDVDRSGAVNIRDATTIQKVIAGFGVISKTGCVMYETGDHVHNYEEVVVEPGCKDMGYTNHSCICGYEYHTDETNAVGHKYVDTVIKPTCTEKGYTLHQCSRCHHSYSDNYTNTVGDHLYDSSGKCKFCGDQKPSLDSIGFSVTKHDYSLYHSRTGKLLIEQYYEQVEVSGNSDVARKINEALSTDSYSHYFVGEDQRKSYEEMVDINGYGSFCNYYTADITHNSGGILCVKISMEWYMGGVHNSGSYGLNFSLLTGELLSLSDVTGESFYTLKPKLDRKIKERINPYYYDELDEMGESEYPYYIENGEIVLSFPEYKLGCGAETPIRVHTGIYV